MSALGKCAEFRYAPVGGSLRHILNRRGHPPNHKRREDPDTRRQDSGATGASIRRPEGGSHPRWQGGAVSEDRQDQIESRTTCG